MVTPADESLVATIEESFTPLYRLQTTPAIPYSATAREVQVALKQLRGLAHVQVQRSVSGHGYDWSITLRGRETSGDRSCHGWQTLAAGAGALSELPAASSYSSSCDVLPFLLLPNDHNMKSTSQSATVVSRPFLKQALRLAGLLPGYQVGNDVHLSVKAYSEQEKASEAVATSVRRTGLVVPPAAPSIVKASIASSAAVSVSWSAPRSTGGR